MKTNIISNIFMVVLMLFCLPVFSQNDDITLEKLMKTNNFRFAVGGGYAFKLEKPNDTGNRKSTNGLILDADGQYFFNDSWGLGLNSNVHAFSTSLSEFAIPGKYINDYEETHRVFFFGPSIILKSEYRKFLWIGSIGVGPLYFMGNITVNGVEGKNNQTTDGYIASFSGEYKMDNKMGIGFKLSNTSGNIYRINHQGQTVKSEDKVLLSYYSFSIFLSLRT